MASTLMARTLFRGLHRTLSHLRRSPQLSAAILNGVVRRTKRSRQAAALQIEAAAIDGPELRRRFSETTGAAGLDEAFAALRSLGDLLAALTVLESEGAFTPLRRTSDVQFVIGQSLVHSTLGPCIPYGWDLACRAVEPPSAAAMDRAGIGGIVDNRKTWVGIDAAERQQPFYRVQLQDGRGHYCAQCLLEPAPLTVPIQGTSFFFTAADRGSNCLLPNAELAARFPDDVALIRSGALRTGDSTSPLH